MRRSLIVLAVLVLIGMVGPVAHATVPLKRELRTYKVLRHAVKDRYGSRVPGRHIVKLGVRTRHGVRPATAAEVGRSIRTFRRWLAPPMGSAKPGDRLSSVPAQAGGRWAIPAYIVNCESHGSYTARNPSGAYGAYQIMPGTAAAYGCDLSTPAGQDQCAARIWRSAGPGAWACA